MVFQTALSSSALQARRVPHKIKCRVFFLLRSSPGACSVVCMNDVIYIETSNLLLGDTDVAEFFDALDLAISGDTVMEDADTLRQMAQAIRNTADRKCALNALSRVEEQTKDALYA